METYEILSWCNQTLQGQFRKYPSVIDSVISLCVDKNSSLEETKEKFSQINYAVARILAGAEEDTDEVIEYAERCNNYSLILGVPQIEKKWIERRALVVGKTVIAEDQQGQIKRGTVSRINNKGTVITVKFDDESVLDFSDTWREHAYKHYRDESKRTKGKEIPNYFTIKKVF